MNDAKCLLMCYEENAPGLTAGHPVFARYGVRDGINVYLTTNRPDEATMLAEGKMITRPNESKLEPLDCSILPRDYEITRKSKIQITQIERTAAQYYRKLWTHNFVGSSAPINMAVLIAENWLACSGWISQRSRWEPSVLRFPMLCSSCTE